MVLHAKRRDRGGVEAILTLKKGVASHDATRSQGTVEDVSQQLNGSFGIANARYQLIKEFNEERQTQLEAQRLALAEVASLKVQLAGLNSRLQLAEGVAPQLPALQTRVIELTEENKLVKQEKQQLQETLLEVRAQLTALQVNAQRADGQRSEIILEKQQLAEKLEEVTRKVELYEQRIAELERAPQRAEPQPEAVGVASAPAEGEALRLRTELRGQIVELASLAGQDKQLKAYCKDQLDKLERAGPQELQAMLKETKQLAGITTAVNSIVTTLRADTGIFSFGVSDKAIAVEKAMAAIPPQQRVQLLDYQQVKGKSSEFPQINGLFDALLHQRAYIFKAKEATSFKSFKEKMDNIKDSTENDVGPGHPQHHSSV